jgi:hypothetical protein
MIPKSFAVTRSCIRASYLAILVALKCICNTNFSLSPL